MGVLPDRTTVKNGALKIHRVKRDDGGVYICKAKNILGTAEGATLLMVFSRLQFTVRPPKQINPGAGSPVHLPCVAESDLSPTVTWLKDGKPSLPVDSNILQNNTLVIPSANKSHVGTYSCRASNALTTIEASVEITLVTPPSCSVIRKYVSSSSGNYVSDPDGEGGLAPFTVHCDMRDKSGVGVTVISHNSESRILVDGYDGDGDGDYSRSIRYSGANLSQLASLTNTVNSSSNMNATALDCGFTGFLLVGGCHVILTRCRTGGGASPGSNNCACGMTNSCADSSRACNCDKNDYVWREDSGFLTEKSQLPVKELRFGDTGMAGSVNEKGYHSLGKFKCYGIGDESDE